MPPPQSYRNDCFRPYAGGSTLPVGSKPLGVSPYGALDMAGNVAEWVQDWYSATYYSLGETTDPRGPSSGTERVVRGGDWQSVVVNVRAASRSKLDPTKVDQGIGFRCAR